MELKRTSFLKRFENRLSGGINELGEKFQAVQILPELQKSYPGQIKGEIVSVRFYQTEKACYLETTIDEDKERGVDSEDESYSPYVTYSRTDYRTHRQSLAFISTMEDSLFRPNIPVLDNAAAFLCEMDPYSMINCTDLFTAKAAEKINEKYINRLGDDAAEDISES